MLVKDFCLFVEFTTPIQKCMLHEGCGYVQILTTYYNGVHVDCKALKTSNRGPVSDTCLDGIL